MLVGVCLVMLATPVMLSSLFFNEKTARNLKILGVVILMCGSLSCIFGPQPGQ